jgi:hypothetical protein
MPRLAYCLDPIGNSFRLPEQVLHPSIRPGSKNRRLSPGLEPADKLPGRQALHTVNQHVDG